MSALDLGGRRVREIRQVPLARVDDEQPAPARRREHLAARFDRSGEARHVVAERLAEPARLEEIALHVDDDQRGAVEVDRDRLRLGVDEGFGHCTMTRHRRVRPQGHAPVMANFRVICLPECHKTTRPVPAARAVGEPSTSSVQGRHTMPDIKILNPDALGKPLGQYSHMTRVKASEFLFIAGQVAVKDGKLVGADDFDAQCVQTFANIEAALKSAGAGLANIVEFTTYLVHSQDIAKFMTYRLREFPKMFPGGAYPPNTLLIVDRLVQEGFLIEVQAVAAL